MSKTANQLYEPRREKIFLFLVHAPDSSACVLEDIETNTSLLISD